MSARDNITKNIFDQFNSYGYKINDYEWEDKAVRLVAAWNTHPDDVEAFLNIIKS